MYLIIFAHPDNEKSHNAAVLKHVVQRLKGKFEEYEVIDLYADGFDPVLRLTPEDDGKTELVEKYKSLIKKADCLIFISPVWWYSMPAILKGFIDIVFSPGFAHDFDPQDGNLRQCLKGKKAIVINSYGRSEEEWKEHKKAPELVLDLAVLKFTGIDVVSRVNWFDVRSPSLIPKDIIQKIDEALSGQHHTF
jgi:NAD(P)H dehydrogenase (quinone)